MDEDEAKKGDEAEVMGEGEVMDVLVTALVDIVQNGSEYAKVEAAALLVRIVEQGMLS